MKPKYKLGQQVYALRISQGSLHVYQGAIEQAKLAQDKVYYAVIDGFYIPESNIYRSKKALKIAFNRAFEKLNNVGEPF